MLAFCILNAFKAMKGGKGNMISVPTMCWMQCFYVFCLILTVTLQWTIIFILKTMKLAVAGGQEPAGLKVISSPWLHAISSYLFAMKLW